MLMLSHVWLFATPWTVACQAPLSMGFSRQEYWSGLPFPLPGDLPDSGIKPASPLFPARQADFLPVEPKGSKDCNGNSLKISRASLVAQLVKNPRRNAGDLGSIPGLGRSSGEGKTTHSSILAWRIPQTVQSMGSQRVRHSWATFTFTLETSQKDVLV